MLAELKFTPVRPKRAYEHLVEEIEGAVLSGAVRPGEHLPSERDLREQFKVSRATVREALRVLESHGLVQSRPGDPRGPKVLPISSTPLLKSMERFASRTKAGLGAVLEFRIVLEGAAAFLAAHHRTQEDLDRLEVHVADLAKATHEQSLEAISRADLAFHEAMATAGGNALIQVSNRAVRGVSLELITKRLDGQLGSAEMMSSWVDRHAALLAAITDRDAERAAELVGCDIVECYAAFVSEPERRMLHLIAMRANEADTATA